MPTPNTDPLDEARAHLAEARALRQKAREASRQAKEAVAEAHAAVSRAPRVKIVRFKDLGGSWSVADHLYGRELGRFKDTGQVPSDPDDDGLSSDDSDPFSADGL